MVIVASGITHGHVRTTATKKRLRNMAAILQIIGLQRHTALVYRVPLGHQCFDQLTRVKTKYLLTSITLPYHRLKSTTHWGNMSFWSWPLAKCWLSIGSWAHVRLTCCKQGRIVQKPVNTGLGLKFIRIITFSCIQMSFAALFVYKVIITLKTESQTINRKSHRKVSKLKSNSSFLFFFMG